MMMGGKCCWQTFGANWMLSTDQNNFGISDGKLM